MNQIQRAFAENIYKNMNLILGKDDKLYDKNGFVVGECLGAHLDQYGNFKVITNSFTPNETIETTHRGIDERR